MLGGKLHGPKNSILAIFRHDVISKYFDDISINYLLIMYTTKAINIFEKKYLVENF